MTAQVLDSITVEGVRSGLASTPLGVWLDAHPDHARFVSPHTANWRGYVADWSVRDDTLWLDGVHGWVPLAHDSAGSPEEVDLERLGDANLPVEATWVSGELRVVQGEIIAYVHGGFGSTWEIEIVLSVDQGRIIDRRRVDNRPGGWFTRLWRRLRGR